VERQVPEAAARRLWRARKQHDSLDALLRPDGSGWELRYVLNRRLLLRHSFDSDADARAAAEVRLKELQRAGWNVHW
jgi:hypothetical protein